MFRKILSLFLFSMALIFAFLFFLFNGIKIQSFSLGNIYISKLYIKLDKKLIVNIDKLKVSSTSKSDNTYEELKKTVELLPTYLQYFQTIKIDSLEVSNNHFTIELNDKEIYLDNKLFNLSTKYSIHGKTITLDLYSVYLKAYELLLRGKFKANYFKDIANFFGTYTYKEKTSGELNLQFDRKFINFFVNTNEIKDIKFLRTLFRLDKIAEEWMYDNVTGDMKINYLHGKLDTKTLEPIMNSIKGDANIKNAHITFNKEVAPVITPDLHITYEKDTLNFHLKKPKYKNLSIQGSEVSIKNLTSEEKGRVDVHLKYFGSLSQDVLDILNAYDISLPIKQTKGKTDAWVYLKIPYIYPMEYFGEFKFKDSSFLLNTFPFSSKNGLVKLNNEQINIIDSNFNDNKMLDSIVNLNLNINTMNAYGKAFIKSFYVQDKGKDVIKIKDLESLISLDFNETTDIFLDNLQTNIKIYDDYTHVKVNDLSIAYPYSQVLKDINIKEGNLELDIINKDDITFNALIKNPNLPIKRDDKIFKELEVKGQIKKGILTLTALKDDINLSIINDGLNLTLKNLQVFNKLDSNKSKSLFKTLNLNFINSKLLLADKMFFAKDINLQSNNKNITFSGVVSKLDFPISKHGKKITSLDIEGTYNNDLLTLKSSDGAIKVLMNPKEHLKLYLNNIELHYDTEAKQTIDSDIEIHAKNSKVIVNNRFDVITTKFDFISKEGFTHIFAKYNETKFSFKKDKKGFTTIRGSKISDDFVNNFFRKDFVKGGYFDVFASGQNGIVSGKMDFEKNKFKNLRILNNIITLVNTSPALINPLLAIPAVFGMVTNGGFNVNGYSVVKGSLEFTHNFNNEFFNVTKLHTIGNSVDFDGFGTIDFKNKLVNGEINVVFMKDYSKIVDYIPVVDYIFLGENRQVSTLLNIHGNLEKPDIETNFIKDSASAPINIMKRIFVDPFINIFGNSKEENKKETNK